MKIFVAQKTPIAAGMRLLQIVDYRLFTFKSEFCPVDQGMEWLRSMSQISQAISVPLKHQIRLFQVSQDLLKQEDLLCIRNELKVGITEVGFPKADECDELLICGGGIIPLDDRKEKRPEISMKWGAFV